MPSSRHRSRSPNHRSRDDKHKRQRGDEERHRYSPSRVKNEPRDHFQPSSSDHRRRREDAEDGRRQERSQMHGKWEQEGDRDARRKDREDHRRQKQKKEEQYVWGGKALANAPVKQEENEVSKAKPSFEKSGKLTEDTNKFNGIVIKYNEPPEARKPKVRWRLYPFKGDQELPVYQIHRQSAYLLGRERQVADIPIDHPSCSKQHAIIQYRSLAYERPDGQPGRRIRPYVIDLGSANGTYLNNNRIEAQRYYELQERDVMKFGFSSREYVILHENSRDAAKLDKGSDSEASSSASGDEK